MEKFDVHKWNKQRRASMLNEGFGAEAIGMLKQMYRDFKINSKGEDRETMSRLNYLMDIIEKAYDLYDLQAIDKETLDGIIDKYGKLFQDEIDNSSDSFIKYTDFERSTDEQGDLEEGMTLNFSNKDTGLPYNLDFSEVPMFKSGISVLYDAMVKVHNAIGDSSNPNRELKEQFKRLLKMAMGYTGGTAGVDKFIDPRVATTLRNTIENLDGERDGKEFRILVLNNIKRFTRG